ncbi:MAG: lysophospholipid acyltransferase family protein [Deltaproteobacteria bacterium]|nr:lysophospholipid acyltransferase family protein [Deltaproteobacteria bacterium]
MTWSRKQHVKNDLIYIGARLCLGCISSLSNDGATDLGAALGRLGFHLARKDAKIALSNIEKAMGRDIGPGEIRQIAIGCFEHLGTCAGELASVLSGKLDPIKQVQIDDEDKKNLERALSLGRGVVAVTAHLGNWELLAMALAEMGFPINTVARRSYDKRFGEMINRFRESHGVHCLYRGDPSLVENATAKLGKNEVLGLLIDQDTKVPGVFVEFFGRPAYTPTGAAVLAKKSNCPLLTIFTHRTKTGIHKIEIMRPIDKSRAKDWKQAVLEDTQALTRRIEIQIKRHPSQWVWMHKRWNTRPGSTGSGNTISGNTISK